MPMFHRMKGEYGHTEVQVVVEASAHVLRQVVHSMRTNNGADVIVPRADACVKR